MNTEKLIVVLNNLVEVNTERIAMYQSAKKTTEEDDLIALFTEFEKVSSQFKEELIFEIKKMGGIPVEFYKKKSSIEQLWCTVKANFLEKNREDILNKLEYTEFEILKNYKKSLPENVNNLTAKIRPVLKSQLSLLATHHDKVKQLGDLLLV